MSKCCIIAQNVVTLQRETKNAPLGEEIQKRLQIIKIVK